VGHEGFLAPPAASIFTGAVHGVPVPTVAIVLPCDAYVTGFGSRKHRREAVLHSNRSCGLSTNSHDQRTCGNRYAAGRRSSNQSSYYREDKFRRRFLCSTTSGTPNMLPCRNFCTWVRCPHGR